MPRHTRPTDPELPGIGPSSRAWLAQAGVHSLPDLQARDAVALYLQIQASQPRASLNLLYALVGAQQGLSWQTVMREQRSALLTELDLRRAGTPPSA